MPAPKKSTPPQRTFEDLVALQPPVIRETARALRKLVRAAMPDANEFVYGGAKSGLALYSLGTSVNVAVGIGPGPKHCLLYVHNVKYDDTKLELEGKGNNCLHLKLKRLENPAAVRALIKVAYQRARAKM